MYVGLQVGIHDAIQLTTHCLESLARLHTALKVVINSYFSASIPRSQPIQFGGYDYGWLWGVDAPWKSLH